MSQSRLQEVSRCIKQLDTNSDVLSELMARIFARQLEKICENSCGCLSPGGSSVKDWVRLRLNDCGLLAPNSRSRGVIEPRHVVGVLHFWAWDVDKYGPSPGVEKCGGTVDTMRSPLYRLRDSKPIDRVAWRVAGP